MENSSLHQLVIYEVINEMQGRRFKIQSDIFIACWVEYNQQRVISLPGQCTIYLPSHIVLVSKLLAGDRTLYGLRSIFIGGVNILYIRKIHFVEGS